MGEDYTMEPLFLGKRTSLQDIANAGWRIEHFTYGWCFRHEATGKRQSIPFWINEFLSQAEQDGMAKLQAQLQYLLTAELSRLPGSCGPSLPQPKVTIVSSPSNQPRS